MSRMYSELAMRRILEQKCEAAGGQKAWADANEVSAQYVCDVIQGRRKPGDAICEALGYRRHEIYTAALFDVAASDYPPTPQ
jgi:hypothetical protein